jgi:uncharacterized protein (TIGR00106 family)
MKVIADLCVVPMGIGVSVSKEVAVCERILAEAGLKTKLHAYGTNIEGEWDDVFAAIKRCHEAIHAVGALSDSERAPTASSRWRIKYAAWTKSCGVLREASGQ